jgi:hypothetical protein
MSETLPEKIVIPGIPPIQNARPAIAQILKLLESYFSSSGIGLGPAKIEWGGPAGTVETLPLVIEVSDGTSIEIYFQAPQPKLTVLWVFSRDVSSVSISAEALTVNVNGPLITIPIES